MRAWGFLQKLRNYTRVITLTASLEAAIAAVFEHLKNLIIIEIDDEQPQTYWRQIVIAARKEAEGEEIPSPDCEDLDEWGIQLECVEEGILWDADYEIEHLYADRSLELPRAVHPALDRLGRTPAEPYPVQGIEKSTTDGPWRPPANHPWRTFCLKRKRRQPDISTDAK